MKKNKAKYQGGFLTQLKSESQANNGSIHLLNTRNRRAKKKSSIIQNAIAKNRKSPIKFGYKKLSIYRPPRLGEGISSYDFIKKRLENIEKDAISPPLIN